MPKTKNRKNEIVYICGAKGTGKTYLADRLASGLYLKGERVICISPADPDAFKISGIPIVKDPDLDRFERLQGRSVLIQPSDDSAAFMAIDFAYQVGNCWLFIDEIDLYLSYNQPYERLLHCVRYGRHNGLNLCGICQRPANVHKDLLAQADRVITFRMTLDRDLDQLKKWRDVDPEAVKSLPDRKYLSL